METFRKFQGHLHFSKCHAVLFYVYNIYKFYVYNIMFTYTMNNMIMNIFDFAFISIRLYF